MSVGVAASRRGRAVAPATGLALAVLAIGASAAEARVDWTALRTLNIAHQGGENEAPSNTMYAYERALRLGADMLEVDVHTTADGEVVVLHDATVDRTTNGSGRVDRMTLDQVQALDAAHNLVPGEGTRVGRERSEYPFRGVRTGERKPPPGSRRSDFRVPTLREVLRAYPTVPINIEIKGNNDLDVASFLRNAEALARLLNRHGRTDGINVASFNDLAIQRFRQLAPQIDLAPGVAGVAGFKLLGLPPGPGRMVVLQVPMSFEGIPVADADFVRRAHAGGYAVHVWTVNDEPTMLQLLRWGVDGVMTAAPARLERVLCEQRIERPRRSRSVPGRHCNPNASIACEVTARGPARRAGPRRLRVRLRRADRFAGPCAGRVSVELPGSGGRARGRFDFGELPPGDGGPRRRLATVRLRLNAIERARGSRARALVTARPYDGFANRTRVPIR